MIVRLLAAIYNGSCDIWYTLFPPEDSWELLGIPYAWRTLGALDTTPDELARDCPVPTCRRPAFVGCRTITGRRARTHKARQR